MSDYFKHPQALVESARVGAGTRVWAFAHILPGAVVGADCNICDNVFIENQVIVGDHVTIKCGVQLWDGICIEDDVFIGPNATFTNDLRPRSKQHLAEYPKTVVRHGASIGANATILPGLTIGQGAMIGAGAVVTRSVPPFALVVGNPARIVRYVDAEPPYDRLAPSSGSVEMPAAQVPGVQLMHAPTIKDLRGNLIAREIGQGFPFRPDRVFFVFDVPGKEVRGAHAHRKCKQFLICLRGSVSVVCDDGQHRQEFELSTPEVGLYLPPMVWGIQYKYTADAMLMVLASDPYDAADYIRNYDEFLVALKA